MPIYLTGSHTWGNFASDYGAGDLPAAFDFNGYLDFLVAHHHNFFRGWVWELTYSVQGHNGGPFHWSPFPWQRTGRGKATDGKPKFDLSTIAAQVKTDSAQGTPLVVFNDLSWPRSDAVEANVPENMDLPVRVVDADGREVPSQLTTRNGSDEANVAAAALGAKATASSMASSDYAAEKAIDGRWAVRDPDPALGASDEWKSAAGAGPHWLRIDLGQPRTLPSAPGAEFRGRQRRARWADHEF